MTVIGCETITITQDKDLDNNEIILEEDEKDLSMEDIENYESVYFINDVTTLNYEGQFQFYDPVRKKVTIREDTLLNNETGRFTKLFLDGIDGVPNERLLLGYLYETNEVIYKIAPTDAAIKQIVERNEIPEDSIIICQRESSVDTLSETEGGFHHYIDVEHDEITYHSYNNLTETGYYETFVWKVGVGLIHYKSGFGAERESIKLSLVMDH